MHMELLQLTAGWILIGILAAMTLGLAFVAWRLFGAIKKAEDEASIDPAGAGGPRPKPAGTDMEAQAAGGPRPKV
jgi:hypothetical protein